MKKIIIFSRVSSIKQDLKQQTEQLREEAVRLGYSRKNQILIEHKESGISLKEEDRIGLEKLKFSILSDASIDCMICWEISRIARRADVIYSIREFLIEHHIRWICLNPYVEVLDKDGKQNQMSNIMLAVFTSFAESEMDVKKERAARGREHRKALGKHTGGLHLFGYQSDKKGNRIVHEENAKLVRRMFETYAAGTYSIRRLAKELKEDGYFQTQKMHSLPNIISGYLKDERYTGRIFGWPQIISETLYNKCQAVAKEHNLVQKTCNKGQMFLKGLIFSDLTGFALNPIPSKGQYKSHPDYGPSVGIMEKYIHPLALEYIEQEVNAKLADPLTLRKEEEKKYRQIFKKEKVARKELAAIQQKIDRAEERYIEGNIQKSKLDDILMSLKNDMMYQQEQIISYDEQLAEIEHKIPTIDKVDFSNISYEDLVKWTKKAISKIYVRKEKPLSRRNIIRIISAVDGKETTYMLSTQNKGPVKWEKLV